MVETSATAAGTKKWAEKAGLDPSKRRNFDGLSISALGCGTYLGQNDDATDRLYEETLIAAGLGGVNFFDTAINYRSMRSEKVLKKVLSALFEKGLSREELVISTKGGFIPVEGPFEEFEDYVRVHYFDTGIINPKEVAAECHCMSPLFLENQIAASLKNMGLEAIDLYYLHNPEIELSWLEEDLFYKKLTEAFALFEKKVQEKKIKRYGLATWNGFRQKRGALQIEKVMQAALEAGGDSHHFKAIQLPLNIVMLEAMKVKNQVMGKEEMTILQAAEKCNVAVFASAPLMQSEIRHLPSRVFEKLPVEKTFMQQALQFVLSIPYVRGTFVGMKEAKHWNENQELLFTPTWNQEAWKGANLSVSIEK